MLDLVLWSPDRTPLTRWATHQGSTGVFPVGALHVLRESYGAPLWRKARLRDTRITSQLAAPTISGSTSCEARLGRDAACHLSTKISQSDGWD